MVHKRSVKALARRYIHDTAFRDRLINENVITQTPREVLKHVQHHLTKGEALVIGDALFGLSEREMPGLVINSTHDGETL